MRGLELNGDVKNVICHWDINQKKASVPIYFVFNKNGKGECEDWINKEKENYGYGQ